MRIHTNTPSSFKWFFRNLPYYIFFLSCFLFSLCVSSAVMLLLSLDRVLCVEYIRSIAFIVSRLKRVRLRSDATIVSKVILTGQCIILKPKKVHLKEQTFTETPFISYTIEIITIISFFSLRLSRNLCFGRANCEFLRYIFVIKLLIFIAFDLLIFLFILFPQSNVTFFLSCVGDSIIFVGKIVKAIS